MVALEGIASPLGSQQQKEKTEFEFSGTDK